MKLPEEDRKTLLDIVLLLETEHTSERFLHTLRFSIAAELRMMVSKYGGMPKDYESFPPAPIPPSPLSTSPTPPAPGVPGTPDPLSESPH